MRGARPHPLCHADGLLCQSTLAKEGRFGPARRYGYAETSALRRRGVPTRRFHTAMMAGGPPAIHARSTPCWGSWGVPWSSLPAAPPTPKLPTTKDWWKTRRRAPVGVYERRPHSAAEYDVEDMAADSALETSDDQPQGELAANIPDGTGTSFILGIRLVCGLIR